MRGRTTTSRTSIGSDRDWQKCPELGGGQGCRGKSFDTSRRSGRRSLPPLSCPIPMPWR
jgi:hypothetical protein